MRGSRRGGDDKEHIRIVIEEPEEINANIDMGISTALLEIHTAYAKFNQ